MYTLDEAHRAGWEGEKAQAFVDWMNELEHHVTAMTGGLGPYDIVGDWEFAGNFEAGLDPYYAAEAIVADADFPYPGAFE